MISRHSHFQLRQHIKQFFYEYAFKFHLAAAIIVNLFVGVQYCFEMVLKGTVRTCQRH